MEKTLGTIAQMMQDLYAVPVTILDSPEKISGFCNRYQLHPLQIFLTQSKMSECLGELTPAAPCYVTDLFRMNFVLFLSCGRPVCLGPFCTSLLTEYHFIILCQQHQITDLPQKDFLAYRSQFPNISYETITQITFSFLKNTDGLSFVQPMRKIDFTDRITGNSNRISDDEFRRDYYEILNMRYATEQRFMKNIEQGNSYSALLDFKNMKRNVAYLKQLGTSLDTERTGAAIIRTLIRISALKAGLPAAAIDTLSSQNTRAVIAARTVEEIFLSQEKMIQDFCREIHQHQNQNYSNLVLSAMYYMKHQFVQDLTVKEIAKELDVTPNYLISQFHAETGMTPLSYLRNIRLGDAAILLTTTDYAIQEISNMVGIPDANYFTKLFKREYQETPGNYRKYHRL